jgi:hypothetical protein
MMEASMEQLKVGMSVTTREGITGKVIIDDLIGEYPIGVRLLRLGAESVESYDKEGKHILGDMLPGLDIVIAG